jgi:hypothetical protein
MDGVTAEMGEMNLLRIITFSLKDGGGLQRTGET